MNLEELRFEQVRDAIASRMGAHTITAEWGEAWSTFLALLRLVKAHEVALPLPPLAPEVQEAVELAKWVVTKPHLDLTGEAGTILARALLKVVGQ